MTLTPLGVLLAESILHTITPDPDQPVGGMVESAPGCRRRWRSRRQARGWPRGRRTARSANCSVLDEAFEGPMLRFIAFGDRQAAGRASASGLARGRETPCRVRCLRAAVARVHGEPVEAEDDRDEAGVAGHRSRGGRSITLMAWKRWSSPRRCRPSPAVPPLRLADRVLGTAATEAVAVARLLAGDRPGGRGGRPSCHAAYRPARRGRLWEHGRGRRAGSGLKVTLVRACRPGLAPGACPRHDHAGRTIPPR